MIQIYHLGYNVTKGGDYMATTKAQQKAVNKYMQKAYDNLRVVVPKGRKTDVEQFAQARGLSVNGLVNGLLMREMGMNETEWKAKQGNGE